MINKTKFASKIMYFCLFFSIIQANDSTMNDIQGGSQNTQKSPNLIERNNDEDRYKRIQRSGWLDENITTKSNLIHAKEQDSSDKKTMLETHNSMETNRFYYSIGLGIAWSGFDGVGSDVNKNIGIAPLMMSFGWSFMFNKWIGLRPYVSADMRASVKFNKTQENINAFAGISTNGSINLDLLFNFYNSSDYFFRIGGVAGVGFAGVISGGAEADTSIFDGDANIGRYSSWRLNTGLKMVWKEFHGLEILARIPIKNNKFSSFGSHKQRNSNYREGVSLFVAYSVAL